MATYIQETVHEGWSRDASAKKYTNKVCNDNVLHPLYIPTLAFWVAVHIWGTCRNGKSILTISMALDQYRNNINIATLHIHESEVYDDREKQA